MSITSNDLQKLRDPFPENEIEWRIGQSGKKGNNQVWAKCFAYVTSRAIMARLDDVCGMGGWKASYRTIPSGQGIAAGVMCELSIKVDGEWVTKEDGADQTDMEAFKGGISSALKRAGAVWGIGRYLYGLEEGWVTISEQGRDGVRYQQAKTKTGEIYEFYWLPPALPQWALPVGHDAKPSVPRVGTQQPSVGDGVIDPAKDSTKSVKPKPKVLGKSEMSASLDPALSKARVEFSRALRDYRSKFSQEDYQTLLTDGFNISSTDGLSAAALGEVTSALAAIVRTEVGV